MFKFLKLCALNSSLLILAACAGQSTVPDTPGINMGNSSGKKIEVTTSFYPLAYFAEKVGGNLVHVTNLTPPGAEPHDYEPTPQEIAEVYSSDLFLYTGGGVSPWAEKLDAEAVKKGVRVTDVIALIGSVSSQSNYLLEAPTEQKNAEPLLENSENPNSDHKSFSRPQFDPHFWLDPLKAIDALRLVKNVLTSVDPDHADIYDFNAQKIISDLGILNLEYQTALKNCQQDTIVVSHNAFRYLAERYKFNTESLSGISPDAEPSPGTLARISDLVRSKNIKYLFFETLVSPKITDTLASETGATALVLNPIEGLTEQDLSAGNDYLSLMRSNLQNLKTALECGEMKNDE